MAMKRFHTHIAVENLDASVDFYSKLFGQLPSKSQPDYAKWMLEDPPVNFAISARGHAPGVNHFGFQVDSAAELIELKKLADAASGGEVLDAGESACCYAKSEKHWTVDPQGLAWEHFHTLSETADFGADTVPQASACCIPIRSSALDAPAATAACCIPNSAPQKDGACCG
jgi:catechol 2,3-dioxygenase-like lactoylglutathione lyase family enzyme